MQEIILTPVPVWKALRLGNITYSGLISHGDAMQQVIAVSGIDLRFQVTVSNTMMVLIFFRHCIP